MSYRWPPLGPAQPNKVQCKTLVCLLCILTDGKVPQQHHPTTNATAQQHHQQLHNSTASQLMKNRSTAPPCIDTQNTMTLIEKARIIQLKNTTAILMLSKTPTN